MNRLPLCASLLCLAIGTAQEPPFLELTTSEGRLIEGLRNRFGGPPAPQIEPAATQMLIIDSGQQLAVFGAEPLPAGRVVDLTVRPAAWMTYARPAVDALVRGWRPRLALFGQLLGLPASMGPRFLDQMVRIVSSTAELRVLIEEPRHGLDVTLRLLPATGTALQRWTGLLSARRARTLLPGEGDAALRMRVSLAEDRVQRLVDPFLDIYNAMQTSPADLAEAREDLVQTVACLDGTFDVVADSQGIRMAIGLADASAHHRLMTSAATLRRARAQLARQRIEVEHVPAAFRHRDVEPMRTSVVQNRTIPALDNGDGEIISYSANVDDCWLGIVGGNRPEETMTAAIDGVLDGKLFRPSTGAGPVSNFLILELGLDRLTDYLPPSTTGISTIGGFERLRATAARAGAHLQLTFQLR